MSDIMLPSRLLPVLDNYAKFLRAAGRERSADSIAAKASAIRGR